MSDGFHQVCALLPAALRQSALSLPGVVRRQVEEVRLRAGRRPTVVIGLDELPLPGAEAVTTAVLERTVEVATRCSAHSALERVRQGYFTVQGGHRIGLCGSVWSEDGQVRNLRRLSSLSIRVARAVVGCGAEVLPRLLEEGRFVSTLLLSPPGGGKTTLLRDLVRLLSDGEGAPAMRVGLADERGEVAALWEGVPQLDVGERTDVMEGCAKAEAMMMLLRGMNPQVLCCDEITRPEDCAALEQCAGCGVRLLASVHAAEVDELWQKPLYRALLERKIFARAVVLRRRGGWQYAVEDLSCCG